MANVELMATRLLDEDWETVKYLGARGRYFHGMKMSKEEKEVMTWIRGIRIQVSDIADTVLVNSNSDHEYLKTELGMNIVLPKGIIEELRFKVNLKGDGELSNKVYAIDGFPKDMIEDKNIIEGKVTIGVSKLLQFVPTYGQFLPELELGPWQFTLGKIRKVYVDFSGAKTSTPEWYLKAEGIKNELGVTLTIAKHATVKNVNAEVRCAWVYNPGIFSRLKLGTDEKIIQIYQQA